jgi:hypothetical protein
VTEPEPPIALTAAARRLCLTGPGARDLVARGELQPLPGETLAFDPGHVEQVRQRRQAEAVDYFTARNVDLVVLAERTRALLHPITTTRRGVDAIGALPNETRKLFGRAVLRAASLRDGQGCRWCFARNLAQLYGTPAPQFAPALIALLGRQTCEEDRPMLAAAMAELSAGVHGPAGRPSAARTAPPAAQRATAPPPTAHAAVQRPAAGPAGRATPSVLHAALAAAGVRPDRHEHGPSVVCPRCTP